VSFKAKLAGKWRTGAIGAAIAFFVGAVLWVHPDDEESLSIVARLSYDLPFRFRPAIEVTNSGVWLIYMDELSYKNLGQDSDRPWSRAVHEQLLSRLTKGGAKAVVFDVFFNGPSEIPGADAALANAMTNNGKVVVAAQVHTEPAGGAGIMSVPVRPDEPFRTAARYGFVNLPNDHDLGLRRHSNDTRNPSLAAVAASVLGEEVREADVQRYINYYGPLGRTIPSLPYSGAYNTNLFNLSWFKDKIFLIGKGQVMTVHGTGEDAYPTPFTRWTGENWPGVEIQATILLNLLRGDWLNRLGYGYEFLIVLGIGCAFGFGLTLMRLLTGGIVGVVASLVIAVGAFILWWHQRIWFSWLIPCAIQIPCALGWAVFSNASRITRENARLQAALETAKTEQTLDAKPAPASTGGSYGTSVATLVDRERQSESSPLIPNYNLLRCVGRGAYGEVWLARDLVSTLVAVKIIYRNRLPSDAPYEREFRGLQKFMPISRSHPGFVHILHVGRNEKEDYFYYVMEVGDDEISGQKIDPPTYSARNLANEIKRNKRFSTVDCLAISLQLTGALDHLHRQQLIHRDIKPSNIIFVNNAPKFADIGLVTEMGQDVSTYGTLGYIGRGHGTPTGDVYSLGKVLYQLATGLDVGKFPEIPASMVENTADLQFLHLNKIVLKACEEDPVLRFQSAAEMHTTLLELQTRAKSP